MTLPAPPLVELIGVGKVFPGRRPFPFAAPRPGTVALDGVDLSIQRGSSFGVVGESGSGKTTLVRLIAGLDRPTGGRVEVGGAPPDPRSGRVQMVFQDPGASLDPRMRVRDIIAEPLRDPDRHAVRDRVARALISVGLDAGDGARYPHQFSGGQRQRISLARAIVGNPPVLIADEAVSALDVTARNAVLELLATIAAERDLTLIFVSHDLRVVRRMCDWVAVLSNGRVVESGLVAGIFDHPRDSYTKALLTAVPTLDGSLAAARARAGALRPPKTGMSQ